MRSSRYSASSTIAPAVAMRMPCTVKPLKLAMPSIVPSQPPTNAPATPSRMVMMKPPGSLPGMINFASNPTINPIKVTQDAFALVNLFADYRFDWGPRDVAWVLAVVGVCSVIVNGALVGRVVKAFGERRAQHLVDHALLQLGVDDRRGDLDATVEVAHHPVGTGAVEFRVAVIFKIKYAVMFQKTADDRAHANIF